MVSETTIIHQSLCSSAALAFQEHPEEGGEMKVAENHLAQAENLENIISLFLIKPNQFLLAVPVSRVGSDLTGQAVV